MKYRFRAWDKSRKKMITITNLRLQDDKWLAYDDEGVGGFVDGNHLSPLMQSIGIKDKNGVEVFEGDIIRYMDGESMVVQWSSDGYIGWELYRKKRMGKHFHHIKYMYYDHGKHPKAAEEVIGSIHANPELMEKRPE